jgi:hypothetical protein
MVRLSPFFPAMLVFIGALFVAAGGFWASLRQSNFNAEIRAKNEEIIKLQRENAGVVTGGDSFALAYLQIEAPDGSLIGAGPMPNDVVLVPVIANHGAYPLYDLAVRFVELQAGKIKDMRTLMNGYQVGNLAAGLATVTQIRLPHSGGMDIQFNIFFSGRNGLWTELLRMRQVGTDWEKAIKVMRGADELYREVSPNFPRQKDGTIDWDGELGAKDSAPR